MNPEDIDQYMRSIGKRVTELETHRKHDVIRNERQERMLNDQASCLENLQNTLNEINYGFRWASRIGKFLTAVIGAVAAVIGIKYGVSGNG